MSSGSHPPPWPSTSSEAWRDLAWRRGPSSSGFRRRPKADVRVTGTPFGVGA